MIPEDALCQGEATTFLGRCDRRPTIEYDGKPYCWQHDPERQERIRKERHEIQRIANAAHEAQLEAKWRREDLEKASGVRALTNDDLERIVKVGGIRVFLPWHQND